MRRRTFILGSAAALAGCPPTPPSPTPGTIWKIAGAETVIRFGSGYGAAVYSMIWKGFEFVNALDLGREVQTAYQLNGGGEGYNPTEAGNSAGIPGNSKTVILSANTNGKVFTSSVHPAFWVPYNGQAVSPDTISKTVTVDWNGITNCTRHDVSVTMAGNYSQAFIEGLTGYVNGLLSAVYTCNAGVLKTLPVPSPSGPGGTRTPLPVVMAKPDGSYAIGIYSPAVPPNYIAFINVMGSGVGKWDAAYRDVSPCPKGVYRWTVFYVVGTLADVAKKLGQLATP